MERFIIYLKIYPDSDAIHGVTHKENNEKDDDYAVHKEAKDEPPVRLLLSGSGTPAPDSGCHSYFVCADNTGCPKFRAYKMSIQSIMG